MIFQALTKSHKVELSDLPESAHIIGTSLKLIDDGLYADAKLPILQSIPQWQQLRVVAGTLDLCGNESDYFLMLLRPYLTSTITTTCCLAARTLSAVYVSHPVTALQAYKQYFSGCP